MRLVAHQSIIDFTHLSTVKCNSVGSRCKKPQLSPPKSGTGPEEVVGKKPPHAYWYCRSRSMQIFLLKRLPLMRVSLSPCVSGQSLFKVDDNFIENGSTNSKLGNLKRDYGSVRQQNQFFDYYNIRVARYDGYFVTLVMLRSWVRVPSGPPSAKHRYYYLGCAACESGTVIRAGSSVGRVRKFCRKSIFSLMFLYSKSNFS